MTPTRRYRPTALAATVLTVSALLGGVVGCADRPTTIDLTGWKLTLPEKSDEGKAAEVEPAEVTKPWTTVTGDGSLEFWAPASGGATTPNSSHPRTELVSLTHFRAGMDAHILRASVTVRQVPRDGEGIIVGQIHGAAAIRSVPYVMLRYQSEAVHVVVKNVRKGTDRMVYPLLGGVPLNSSFDFTIADRGNGDMVFTGTHAGRSSEVHARVPAEFVGQTVRFQAGNYQQSDRPEGDDDGGRLVVHRLTESTEQPGGPPGPPTPGLRTSGPPGPAPTGFGPPGPIPTGTPPGTAGRPGG